MTTHRQALSLYRSLMREAKKMPAYNFREYALRRIRDGFRENSKVSSSEKITALISEGKKDLEVLKRQVMIAQLYDTEKLVIEQKQK